MSAPEASGPAQLPALRLHVAAQPSLPRVYSLEAWVLSVAAWHPAHEMSPRGQRLALSPSPQGFFLLNSPSGPEEAGSISFSICPVRMSAGLPLHLHLSSGPLTCSPSIQSGKLCLPGSHLAPVEAPGRQLPNTITTVLTTLLLLNRSVVSDSANPVGGSVALQAPLSMGFSSQEYWSGLPCPPAGDLSNPGIEPASPVSPALAGGFFMPEPPGKPVAVGPQ